MHQILSGINTDKLLKVLGIERQCNHPCVYICFTTIITINYFIYTSIYKESSKEPVDISENQLDKAITIYELLEDSKLALESLRD